MKRLVIFLLVVLTLTLPLSSCGYSEAELNEAYNRGYEAGYEKGMEDVLVSEAPKTDNPQYAPGEAINMVERVYQWRYNTSDFYTPLREEYLGQGVWEVKSAGGYPIIIGGGGEAIFRVYEATGTVEIYNDVARTVLKRREGYPDMVIPPPVVADWDWGEFYEEWLIEEQEPSQREDVNYIKQVLIRTYHIPSASAVLAKGEVFGARMIIRKADGSEPVTPPTVGAIVFWIWDPNYRKVLDAGRIEGYYAFILTVEESGTYILVFEDKEGESIIWMEYSSPANLSAGGGGVFNPFETSPFE